MFAAGIRRAFTLSIGFLFILMPLLSALSCYQCNTTWEMGCWHPYKVPPPGVDPKHLKTCSSPPNAPNTKSYCVKEYTEVPNIHFGYNPYVSRTCATDPVKSQDNEVTFKENEEGCRSWTSVTKVTNKTYELERTICKCSSDKCNSTVRLFDQDLVSLALILCSWLFSLMIL